MSMTGAERIHKFRHGVVSKEVAIIEQAGLCGACGEPFAKGELAPAQDHVHLPGENTKNNNTRHSARGPLGLVLHIRCNGIVGNHSAQLLQKIADYARWREEMAAPAVLKTLLEFDP